MTRLALLAVLLTSACAVSPDQKGQVIAVNSKSVTVRGIGDFSPQNLGKGFFPSEAMAAQAAEVCSGAKFMSATPLDGDSMMIDYLFLCP